MLYFLLVILALVYVSAMVFSKVYLSNQKIILFGRKHSMTKYVWEILYNNHIPILEVYIAYYHIKNL